MVGVAAMGTEGWWCGYSGGRCQWGWEAAVADEVVAAWAVGEVSAVEWLIVGVGRADVVVAAAVGLPDPWLSVKGGGCGGLRWDGAVGEGCDRET